MTRFPRQLAVAVVVLFAFTFLSGCGSDKEDKKEETNNDVSQVVTPDENGDTQPQPDKKSCTVRKNIETKIVSDDGSGGKLTGKNCKQKNAKLKVGDICEFECEDPKDYNKTGHIKCGKDEKIEITAKCNRTDEKKKADEEAEDKKKIVEHLMKILGPGKKKEVKKFVDMEVKGNIKEKLEELDADEKEVKELGKKFENWENTPKRDTAKQNIVKILVGKWPKKRNIEQWVYGTLDCPIPMEKRLKDADASTRAAAEKQCEKGIDKLTDIRLLSPMMLDVIGTGENERKGEIGAYLGTWRGLSKAAKDYREEDNEARKKNLVKEYAKSYCTYQMMKGMKHSEHPDGGTHQSLDVAFEEYLDNKTDLPVTYQQVMSDNPERVSHRYLKRYASDKIQELLEKEELVEEKCYSDVWNPTMIAAIKAATDGAGHSNALEAGAIDIARLFVKDQIIEETRCDDSTKTEIDRYLDRVTDVPGTKGLMDAADKGTPFAQWYVQERLVQRLTEGHLAVRIRAYLLTRNRNVLEPILQSPTVSDNLPVLAEIKLFAIYLADQNRALPPAAAGKIITEDQPICNNWINNHPNIVNVVNVANIATFLTDVQNHL